MKKIRHMMRASGAFLRMLFKPGETISGYSVNGHRILDGWEEAPEERLIAACKKIQARRRKQQRRLALYCFEGAHAGEVLFLGRSFETMGRASGNSLVVTPIDTEDTRRYQMMINGVRTLIAETGTVFKLNGHEQQQAELFDYDELELLGNRFVVMDVQSNCGVNAAMAEKRGQS